MIEILQYPFMYRAIIVGILLSVGLAYIGIFVVLQRMSFYGEGIAHASLAGVAIGLLLGSQPLFTALIFSIFFAVIIYVLEEHTSLSADSLIGVLFTASMSLGLIMMSLGGGYRPELTSFLFGSILSITSLDVLVVSLLSPILMIFFLIAHKGMLLMVLDRDLAYVSGVPVGLYRLCMYVILSMSIVLGVKIAGVVLVSALLITPVSIAKLASKSFKSLFVTTVIVAPVTVVSGIVLSFFINIPTGPTIVLVGSAIFFFVFLYTYVTRRIR